MTAMGLIFNGASEFDSVMFNGEAVETVQFNGTEIWRRIKPIAVPTLSAVSFSTAGETVGPTVNGFDSTIMTQSGTVSTNTPGTYTITWALKDPNKYCWTDGTTGVKEATWMVTGATITFYVLYSNSHYQSSGGIDYYYDARLTFKVPYGKTFGELGNKTYYETTGAQCQRYWSSTPTYDVTFALGTKSVASTECPNIWTSMTAASSLISRGRISKDRSGGVSPSGKDYVGYSDYPVEGMLYYCCNPS